MGGNTKDFCPNVFKGKARTIRESRLVAAVECGTGRGTELQTIDGSGEALDISISCAYRQAPSSHS